jgi:hypothetical protein
MGFGQRAGRFNELGQVLSIKPSTGTPMTEVESYTITSRTQPANIIHARDPIFKPGTETALNANATFFEPVESYSADGTPQFSQFVVNASAGSSLLVSSYNEFFTVTDPGIMGAQAFYADNVNSGAATVVPRAIEQPQTRRRNGAVTVTLTTASTTDTEVAYQDDGVDWCGIAFTTFFTDDTNDTASVSASYRTFSKYLRNTSSPYPATNFANASSAGVYAARADSTATGDANGTYTTTGIFRSKVIPFLRDASGTQYYLKTNVTFS